MSNLSKKILRNKINVMQRNDYLKNQRAVVKKQ